LQPITSDERVDQLGIGGSDDARRVNRDRAIEQVQPERAEPPERGERVSLSKTTARFTARSKATKDE
jgi:hypothetical protein